MGYSEHDDMVRVDFFKESGKWYCTEEMMWTGKYSGDDVKSQSYSKDDGWDTERQFAISLRDLLDKQDGSGTWRLQNMVVVCLEPYHKYSYPIMMTVHHAKSILQHG